MKATLLGLLVAGLALLAIAVLVNTVAPAGHDVGKPSPSKIPMMDCAGCY